jgi:glyoxylase-like metal-dependent hydrolase (beta-lactamase superfamily II)
MSNSTPSVNTSAIADYEVFAIRYATRPGRRAEHFVGGDAHDGDMPMDYFIWLIKGNGRTIVVDTGFTSHMAQQRRRTFLRCPADTLREFGVAPESVDDVIITHLHYDHVGNFSKFPRARFHLQERELQYATGRYMKYPFFSHSFEVDEVVGMVRLNYAGRVELYDGEAQLAPGVTLHPTPGHTAGLQAVRVHTRRGWLVLASDTTHYFENLTSDRPFTVGFHLGHMVDAFRILERLADSPDHIIPGHDPLVMKLYAPPTPQLEGIAVQLDREPTSPSPVSAGFRRRDG